MKMKFITAVCVFSVLFGALPTRADDKDPLDIAMDAGVVRPGCFLATIIGSVVFVAVLPVAATSRSVKKTAHTLVVAPAQATFTRPLGDFTSLNY